MAEAPPRTVAVTRADVEAMLRSWQSGVLAPAGVKAWLASRRAEKSDELLAELLAELDLFEVYLLTTDDVPALLALLGAAEDETKSALDRWSHYRDAIDLDARSKRLKKDTFYRAFCR